MFLPHRVNEVISFWLALNCFEFLQNQPRSWRQICLKQWIFLDENPIIVGLPQIFCFTGSSTIFLLINTPNPSHDFFVQNYRAISGLRFTLLKYKKYFEWMRKHYVMDNLKVNHQRFKLLNWRNEFLKLTNVISALKSCKRECRWNKKLQLHR